MAFPNIFANASTASGAQLDANFNALSANNGSSLIGFVDGDGVATNVSTFAQHQSINSGNAVPAKTFNDYSTGLAQSKIAGQDPGTHNGTQHTILGISSSPLGSGANGAANADFGLIIGQKKQNFLTSTVQGEIDGIGIIVRQGGPAGNGSNLNSDCAGILVDVAQLNGVGFSALLEGVTSSVNSLGTALQTVDVQLGVIDSSMNNSQAFSSTVTVGTLKNGFILNTSGGGAYTNYINFTNTGGVSPFLVDGSANVTCANITSNSLAASGNTVSISATSNTVNGATIFIAGNGVTTPNKYIRVFNGNLQVVNSGNSAAIFSLTDAGVISQISGINLGAVPLISATAPTIASGFGTNPSIVHANGTAAFQINVGTGGTASSGVLTMPAGTNGWMVNVQYNGSSNNMNTYAVMTNTTQVTLTNQTSSTGVAVAWPSGTVLNCTAFAL